MIAHPNLFLVTVAAFCLSAVMVVGYFYLRLKRSAGLSLESLLERLAATDRDRLVLLSENINGQDTDEGATFDAADVWEIVGGLQGLEALEANCDVLIEIALYVQRYHPEALVVAEQLRLDARQIQWCVGRLKGAARVGKLDSAFPDYAQRIASTYCMMTQKVLAVFDASGAPESAMVHRAL